MGYEVLTGDGTNRFTTPLATGHKFNGWADQFLVTPTSGLEDAYISLGYKVNAKDMPLIDGLKLHAAYHQYKQDTGGADIGTEWNLKAAKSFAEHYNVTVKYANYDAEAANGDIEKLWLVLGAKF